MSDSKIVEFWEKNRSLIVFGLMIFFILSTVIETVFGILFLYWGGVDGILYGTILLGGAFVFGCIAFALVRFRNKAS